MNVYPIYPIPTAMKKILPLSILFFLLFTFSNLAQSQNHSTVSVQAEGEVSVTADIILFQININRFKDTAQEAFSQHKEQESFLTSLLKEKGIDEQHITAQPINISPRRQSNRTGVETRQQVILTLEDITQFEEMQLALIENGFDNFSSRFSAKQLTDARDRALEKAVEEARRKAELIAQASGKQLGDIKSINYGSRTSQPVFRTMDVAMEVGTESLLQFEHSLSIKERVDIVYELID